ncbi:NmrA family NAD(P)-binding protein [Paenibacillus bovis]|uniref:NmrA family protein n=1 Tax=Paenibacillus bovis TaxID=1616788 RepID=A0A172ZGN7_9BACL|nr:NmrA family NAD(P)-binding protein [Paenibacillus bovis]ANF96796.1 NmrA family protein [Paenibacillus bovis]
MNNSRTTILLTGATGDLGERITKALIAQGATVKAIVRPGTSANKLEHLHQLGVMTVPIDYTDSTALRNACEDVSCVVSVLNGLRDVMIGTQTLLLNAAVEAGVPRFIPSDYSMDYRNLPEGSNRNLNLRREFMKQLDKTPIKTTSILNGAFGELLTGMAPIVLFRYKRILYWENADQLMDFTTKDNVAAYTARAALDPDTPRFLQIAGDQVSASQLVTIMNELSGQQYRLLRAGGHKRLERLTALARLFDRKQQDAFPAWQGMQYMNGMFTGAGKLHQIDNDRYPDIQWTSAKQILSNHIRNE